MESVLSKHTSQALVDSIAEGDRVAAGCAPDSGYSPRTIPPVPSRMDFGALLSSEGKRVGIEIGVQAGRYFEALLATWHTAQLVFGVDPWSHQEIYEDTANVAQAEQNEFFNTCVRRVAPYGNAYIIKGASPEVASEFPDNFFDFVYLDARHDYTSVLTDMAAFWPKLRRDGILAGHDYRNYAKTYDGAQDWNVQPDGSKHPQQKAVRGAVEDFAALVQRQLFVTWEDPIWASWMLRK